MGLGWSLPNRAWGQGVWAKVQGRGECGVGPRGPWPRAKPVVTSHAGGACGTQGERNIALLPVNNRQPCLESFGAIRRARNLRKPPQLVWAAAADPAARPRPRSESPRAPPPAQGELSDARLCRRAAAWASALASALACALACARASLFSRACALAVQSVDASSSCKRERERERERECPARQRCIGS